MWGNKTHSFLTMLGIIVGVAIVIILVSLVNGYMGSMVESFASMDVNQINISMTNLTSRSLGIDGMYALYKNNTDLFVQFSPNTSLSITVKHSTDETDSTSANGYSEQYLDLKEYTMEARRNISCADIVSRQKVCIIEAFVARELYNGAQSALDQIIKIEGYSSKIMGVVAQKKDDMDDGGTDDFIWPSYSVVARMSRGAVISSYTFTSVDTDPSDSCVTAIEDFLYKTFKDGDLHRVTAMNEMLDSLNEQVAMMSAMLGGIAGISLLVVGMGAMNITLVSTIEHTRKVGIRKSLGADKGTIARRFVIEAVATGSLEGAVGILIGCISTTLVGTTAGITTTPTPVAIAISFNVSVGIGLLSGYVPVNKAANLNLTDALRSEQRDVGVQNKTGGEAESGHKQGISGKPPVQAD